MTQQEFIKKYLEPRNIAYEIDGDTLKVEDLLDLSNTDIETLPDNLSVGWALDLEDCTSLERLPDNLKVGGSLVLKGCTSLNFLPENLTVCYNVRLDENITYKTADGFIAKNVDRLGMKVLNTKTLQDDGEEIIVEMCQYLGYSEDENNIRYVASQDGFSAHGNSRSEAVNDLKFKII